MEQKNCNLKLKNQTAKDARQLFRDGKLVKPTPGMAEGYVQANLVIIPAEYADDFRNFCKQNPKPCPLIEDFKGFQGSKLAPQSDVRTDVALYKIYENGIFIKEVGSLVEIIEEKYKDLEFHTFLIGCSFTFESALQREGIQLRHIDELKNVSMFNTNQPAIPAGPFCGKVVVSMRPFIHELIDKVIHISSKYPTMHGGPVHIGNPKDIGINDINKPDFGDAVSFKDGDIPVFWGCGVTTQIALLNAQLPVAFTHSPGYMFICDAKNQQFEIN